MADKKIRLLVQAEVKKAVQALNKVEKEQKDIKKQNDGLKKSFAAIGGAIAAAFSIQAIANFTASSVKLGSQTISLERSFRNLGKAVNFNDESLGKFRKATDGTVSDVDLMIQANNAMLLGIVENDDAFAELIDNAQRLSKAVGQDALFGIESLTTGIGRQSKLMLDNLGIVLDTNLAYEKFAEANGKAVKDLDENERKQAFIQAALQSTAEKVAQLGEEQLDATDATLALSSAFKNLQGTIGITLQDDVEIVASRLAIIITAIDGLISKNEELKKSLRPDPEDAAGARGFGDAETKQEIEEQRKNNERRNQEIIDNFLNRNQLIRNSALEHNTAMEELDNITFQARQANIENDFFIQDANHKGIIARVKELRKFESDAHKQKMTENLQAAILSGQSSKDAALSVIKAEIAEAQAGLISSIMTSVPFPFNLALAAGAGAMIGKVTDQLLSFQTGGSFVTKGRTTLPIGNGVVVGDNASGMERIDVTPLPSPTSNGNNITINISAPLVDETVVDTIIPAIRRAEKLNL
tara:strand:- start:1 stop:1581 length:1581 start_codon:yes stop_codon:yes gene_type:complete